MRYTMLRSLGIFILALVVASGLSYASPDYSRKSVAELIDDLTEIDSESVALNTSYLRAGFIADETPAALRTGPYGIVFPDAPPQMRELVRRGPLALPELIRHLDDKRLTKLDAGGSRPGNHSVFEGKMFGYEYSPRIRDSQPSGWNSSWTPKSFTTYTLKVGDICYVLIGQIVNRRLQTLQPIPSGFLTVNSPIEAPVLIERVKNDWRNGEPETLKESLLADIGVADFPPNIDIADPEQFKEGIYVKFVVNPALERLRLYFPDSYRSLTGDGLKRKVEFEKQEAAQGSPSTR